MSPTFLPPKPAATPTFYFVGVTTGSSSIMKVFPAWAEHLGLDAAITGIDLPLDDAPENYRAVVEFLKNDPLSLGSLVTTHKLNLYKAASDLFDRVGSDTEILEEVSSISKRGPELWGHAMDPITCGLSLEALVDDGYWARTGGELLLLGAGGSSLALTLYLHRRALAGQDVPSKVVVTNRRPGRLEEMQAVHRRLGIALPVEYHLAPTPDLNDAESRRAAGGFGDRQRHRPRQGPSRLAAHRRGRLPGAGHRLGLQLPRRPGLPRPGALAARQQSGASGGRLVLLPARLDPRHRRGVPHRHPHRRTGIRRPLADRAGRSGLGSTLIDAPPTSILLG